MSVSRLVSLVDGGVIFTRRAVRWIQIITACATVATVLSAGVLIHMRLGIVLVQLVNDSDRPMIRRSRTDRSGLPAAGTAVSGASMSSRGTRADASCAAC